MNIPETGEQNKTGDIKGIIGKPIDAIIMSIPVIVLGIGGGFLLGLFLGYLFFG